MNLVVKLLVNLVGMKVTTKRPVGDNIPTGSVGVVHGAGLAGRILFVEFEADPGKQHRMDRLDIDPFVEPEPVSEIMPPTPRSDSDDDHDELT